MTDMAGSPPRRLRWMQTPSALPWQIARVIEFVAIVVGMAAVIFEFWFERPRDRELRDVQLHATVAELAAHGNVNATSQAVQRILELMHREGVDMTGISVPKVTIRMAEFENVDWSNAHMYATKFGCTQSILDALAAPDQQNVPKKTALCADLRGAYFNGANLRTALFQRAGLSHARFISADLTEAELQWADMSHARLFRADVTAIKAHYVDFSHARFKSDDEPRVAFRWFRPWLYRDFPFNCTKSGNDSMKCAHLERVLFLHAKMPDAAFLGAKIVDVDFGGATLRNARFACNTWDGDPDSCTEVANACFSDAILSDATFRDVRVENSNFSNAKLDRATFKNVTFENVVFSVEQIKSANFDESSLESLNTTAADSSSTNVSRQEPCTAKWREDLAQWRKDLLPPQRVLTTSAAATYP